MNKKERKQFHVDSRGAASVVGKLLEVGLVLLFVGAVTLSLYGGVVPTYQTAAGEEVAERTLSTAAQRIQQAVPPNATEVRAETRVALPDTIRGRVYEVTVDGRSLVISHPNPEIEVTARLALPSSVVSVSGTWVSDRPTVVVVEETSRGLVVRLEVDS